MEEAVFLVAAALMLIGAIGVVASRNPVHSALFLVQTAFGVAILFVLQDAHFLAAVQVVVYAGAIVILFLFVIMLLGVDKSEELAIEPIAGQRPLAVVLGAAFAGVAVSVVVVATDALTGRPTVIGERALDNSTYTDVERFGRVLFTDYIFSLEVTAALLTIAVVGAVALTRRLAGEAAPIPEPASFEPSAVAPKGANDEPSAGNDGAEPSEGDA